MTEMRDLSFLSNTAAARLPAQQPKTRSMSGARNRYVVLGSIYYDADHWSVEIDYKAGYLLTFPIDLQYIYRVIWGYFELQKIPLKFVSIHIDL